MIFNTITNDLNGAINKIGIFNRTFADLKNAISANGIKGLFNSISPAITSNDLFLIKEYNRLVGVEGVSSQSAWYRTMLSSSRSAQALFDDENNLIRTNNGLILSEEALARATNTMTIGAKAASMAFKALSIAGNIIAFTAIAKGIQLATTAIDNWIHRVERANEAMDEAVGEYESAKSSIESVNSELEEQNKRIDELLSKDKLTYAEKGELEELQEITKELLLQKDIEEKRMASASKEAAEKTLDAYQKQYGSYDISKENLDTKLNSEIFPLPVSENDITGNIVAYFKAKELLEDAKKEFNTLSHNGEETKWVEGDIQDYIDAIDDYSKLLDGNIADLQEKRLALEDEYKKAVEKRQTGNEPLTSSEKEIISTYNSIYDAIKMVYEYTNKNGWNEMEIANIFNTKGVEKTKDELIEMSKAGELSPYAIASYKNLNKAIQDSELFLKEGQNAAEAFYQEILNAADSAKELSEVANENPISSSYKSSLDGVQNVAGNLKTLMEVYDDVQDGEEFDWSSILNNDDFEAVFSSAGEAYDNFIKTVTKNPDDITACQDAFWQA